MNCTARYLVVKTWKRAPWQLTRSWETLTHRKKAENNSTEIQLENQQQGRPALKSGHPKSARLWFWENSIYRWNTCRSVMTGEFCHLEYRIDKREKAAPSASLAGHLAYTPGCDSWHHSYYQSMRKFATKALLLRTKTFWHLLSVCMCVWVSVHKCTQ